MGLKYEPASEPMRVSGTTPHLATLFHSCCGIGGLLCSARGGGCPCRQLRCHTLPPRLRSGLTKCVSKGRFVPGCCPMRAYKSMSRATAKGAALVPHPVLPLLPKSVTPEPPNPDPSLPRLILTPEPPNPPEACCRVAPHLLLLLDPQATPFHLDSQVELTSAFPNVNANLDATAVGASLVPNPVCPPAGSGAP